MSIKLPSSQLQIDFSYALEEIRAQFLQEALGETVRTLDLGKVDRELKEFVSPEHLSLVASRGLRGELIFAVPCILSARPKLLAYYLPARSRFQSESALPTRHRGQFFQGDGRTRNTHRIAK